MSVPDKPVLPILIEVLRDGDDKARDVVAEILTRMNPRYAGVRGGLELLRDHGRAVLQMDSIPEEVRLAAEGLVDRIGGLADEALPILIRMLVDDGEEYTPRIKAFGAAAVDPLLHAIDTYARCGDESGSVLLAALEDVVREHPDAATDEVIEVASHVVGTWDGTGTRDAACYLLARCGPRAAADAVDPLLRYLDEVRAMG